MLTKQDYCILFNDALKRQETIVMFCNCNVNYSGRAESFLDTGDRALLVKADNTLLVHQPEGNNPVNYMKKESAHTLSIEDGKLILKSHNPALKEHMSITIHRIYFFNNHPLEDGQSILIKGTEEDMAKMIYDNPKSIEEGFKPVSREEQTKYGFIDVLGTDKNGTLTIIECKRYSADLGAVTQLRRYVEKVQASKGIDKVRGILAAPRITPNAKQMLQDWGFEFKSINPPKYLEAFDKKQKRLANFV